ncbi:MAG: hypothetical protein IPK58_02680 [Acidobacteria bacterium]|nr:hypothetical protein [Acidobacteriota bacterium]
MSLKRAFTFTILLAGAVLLSGCGWISGAFGSFATAVGLSDTGTVIAKKAQIRTSFAVVASDILEVKRGDQLDIIDQVDFEKVIWYRVRARDEDMTEGWIEAQNLITGEVLEKSRKLAEEDRDAQPQANGLLRAKSNLRISPEMRDDNVLLKLDNGSTFEILTWKYVVKAVDVSNVDDSSKSDTKKNGSKSRSAEIEAAKEDNEPEKLDEKYDVWYKVKLDPSVSPAPSGWLFGRQVELQVPNDIVFYQQNNKKFVTWQRIDALDTSLKDEAKTAKPSSWIILSRTNTVKAIDGKEPDFDGVLLLGYDKYDQTHYRIYPLIGEVWGELPLKVEGTNESRTFTLRLRNTASGQIEEKRFNVVFDKTRYKLRLPDDIANYETAKGK